MGTVRFEPSGPLRGSFAPPPDKSISHRAALLGAMGEGETRIDAYLDAADTRSTLAAARTLGATVEAERGDGPGRLRVRIAGIGLRGPGRRHPGRDVEIAAGNAGTLIRLLPGWLAGQGSGTWILDGDASIRRRPMDRVAEPLGRMGATVRTREGRPPVAVAGAALRGIEYRLPVASAQVKSCVLLAGQLADGETAVVETVPTRDHTERMLAAAGGHVATEGLRSLAASRTGAAARVRTRAAKRLELGSFGVPGDFSSAAFALVAAILVGGSEVRCEGVGLNPTRVGLLGILNRMGAAVQVDEGRALGGEPRGDVVARSGSLQATRVGAAEVPLAIDELPLVALLACFAEGETVVTGAEELRHKESDRIATVVEGLRGLGAEIEPAPDGFRVEGEGELRGGVFQAHGDHRLAMLGAVAGLASRQGVEVAGFEAAAISYPGFEADLRALLGP